MPRVSPQLIVFSYHKSGTSLLLHVMTKVCERLKLSLANQFGLVDRLDLEPDVVLLPHSLLPRRLERGPLDRPYRAIRMVRDPRDIWVSGYLYHRHCHEGWCTNTDLDLTPPIQWPKVDYSFAHRPEDWKRDYLERLGGKSYRQNLLDRSLTDGLDFELAGYTGCTLEAMRDWELAGADATDVKLEDVMADFDGAMLGIFSHFGFTPEQSKAALEVARSEDVNRMDGAAIASRPQIHSRTISKWRDILSPVRIARFEALYGDLILALGYDLAGADPDASDDPERLAHGGAPPAANLELARLLWPRPFSPSKPNGPTPAVAMIAREEGVRLSADGVAIRPTVTGQGVYSFVVPAGVGRVTLASGGDDSAGSSLPRGGESRRQGVEVSQIVIRSRAGEIVIPADDPRLITGWCDAEQVGPAVSRRTGGSAEIPWTGVSGPAVVTIHRVTLVYVARGRHAERNSGY
jgi:hypothetical protein